MRYDFDNILKDPAYIKYEAAIKNCGALMTYEPEEEMYVQMCITDMFTKKATISQAVRMLNSLEHVNPSLPEDVALAQMSAIMKEIEANPK